MKRALISVGIVCLIVLVLSGFAKIHSNVHSVSYSDNAAEADGQLWSQWNRFMYSLMPKTHPMYTNFDLLNELPEIVSDTPPENYLVEGFPFVRCFAKNISCAGQEFQVFAYQFSDVQTSDKYVCAASHQDSKQFLLKESYTWNTTPWKAIYNAYKENYTLTIIGHSISSIEKLFLAYPSIFDISIKNPDWMDPDLVYTE